MSSRQQRFHRTRGGFTLIEALVAGCVLSLVLISSYALLQNDATLSRSTLGISVAETRAQAMLHGLERELADARGANPIAQLTQTATDSETGSLRVDSTLGFPPRGSLLVDRGNNGLERLGYASLTDTLFGALSRGEQCTEANVHIAGTEVLWGGLAQPIELQTNPPASLFDGRAQIGNRTVFFRGDGSGFSYRVPTDPSGANDFLDGSDLRWGATVRGVATLDGWLALEFVAKDTFDEARTGEDLNHDGDRTDVFDIGQIRRRTWSSAAPDAGGDDVALSPTVVLQERCAYGRDLDGDGLEDPLFLWDSTRRELSIRVFVLGHGVENQPVVRKVETTVFLRNVAQS